MNLFDLGVLIVIGLSALLSFFRGFVREMLSLASWLGASIITLYAYPHVKAWIRPEVGSDEVAGFIASLGTFFVLLILISILTSFILKFVKTGAEVGVLDNVVGLCFGIARGVLIVAIAYFVTSFVIAEKNFPEWVRDSKSRPYVAKAAEWVAKITPGYLESVTGRKPEDKEAEDTPARIPSGDNSSGQPLVHRVPVIHDKNEHPARMPSIEDLQKRIREENEKR